MGGHSSGRARTLYNKDATQLRHKRHAVLPPWRRHESAFVATPWRKYATTSWWLRRALHAPGGADQTGSSTHLSRVMLVALSLAQFIF